MRSQNTCTDGYGMKVLTHDDAGTAAERTKLGDQLHTALQRGHDIQKEKDKALEVASKAVTDMEAALVETERVRTEKDRAVANIRRAKMFAAWRIIQYYNGMTIDDAFAAWREVCVYASVFVL